MKTFKKIAQVISIAATLWGVYKSIKILRESNQ